jgi:septum formation protein
MSPTPIILASSSPRRKELLSQAGVSFSIIVSGCDETPVPGESPKEMVERLAIVKAAVIADQHTNAFVIGADTTVCIDGEVLGKPESFEQACEMLGKIQGRTHEVLGGIAILNRALSLERVWSHSTKVTMAPMSEDVIARYVRSGEPMDKAGSYAIQGLGLQFVESVEGSYSNVVGLNISALMAELVKLGAHAGQGA